MAETRSRSYSLVGFGINGVKCYTSDAGDMERISRYNLQNDEYENSVQFYSKRCNKQVFTQVRIL